jgi:hypothetical protein
MAEEPTDEQLELVARHGSGAVERALATVQLAERRDRTDELLQLIDASGDTETEGVE